MGGAQIRAEQRSCGKHLLGFQLAGEPATLQEGVGRSRWKDTELSVPTWICSLKSFVMSAVLAIGSTLLQVGSPLGISVE